MCFMLCGRFIEVSEKECTMAEIRVLDDGIINQIAAGEVVERPASVVKELVENAIDAGAKSVTVEIRDGGTSLIRVADNGCGIPAGELRQAFLRHATSKIRNMDDLENVLTLGFRGEALSSVAGVAQVEVLTKTADAENGARIEIHGGEVMAETEAGCTDGTAFTVRNLFYNVPARRKFLKKPAAESGYISDMLSRVAIGHPEVALKYVNNATVVTQTGGTGDMKTAILQVYGREIAEKLIPVDYAKDGFRVAGYLARPEVARGSRAYENIFINGRTVKCAVAQGAVEDAYRTRLPIGRFPVFWLSLMMPPSFVDVNVHPTKLEVRFADERMLYDLMHAAADTALRGQNLIPRAVMTPGAPAEPPQPAVSEETAREKRETPPGVIFFNEPVTKENEETPEARVLRYAAENATAEQQEKPASAPQNEQLVVEEVWPEARTEADAEPAMKPFFHSYRIAGQVFRTYWVVEQGESAYLIDQHAAHERVLYEEFLAKLKAGHAVPQNMLMPIAVKVTEREREAVRDNMDFLRRLGFDAEELNDQAIVVRALPYVFENPADMGFFTELMDVLAELPGQAGDLYDARLHRVATMACKAAVKANDRLSDAEARELIVRLLKLENPFTCPHGRPTVVELTRYELEKMFKRVQ